MTTLTNQIRWAGSEPELISIGTIAENWRELLPPKSPTPIVAGVAQMASSVNFFVRSYFPFTFTYGGNWAYLVRDEQGQIIQQGSYNFEGAIVEGDDGSANSSQITAFSNGASTIAARLSDATESFDSLSFSGKWYPSNSPIYQESTYAPLALDMAMNVSIAPPALLYQIPHGSTVESNWQIHASNPIAIAGAPAWENTLRVRGPSWLKVALSHSLDPAKIALFRETNPEYLNPNIPLGLGATVSDMESTSLAIHVRDGATIYSYPGQNARELKAFHAFRNRVGIDLTTVTTERYGAQLVISETVTPPRFDAAVALRGAARDIEAREVLTTNGGYYSLSALTRFSARHDFKDRTFIYRLEPLRRVTAGWPLPDGTWRVVGSSEMYAGDPVSWKIAILDMTRAVSRITIMASIWNNADVAYVHAAPTPDGGAVAVALLNSATIGDVYDADEPIRQITLEKKWLFKRSFDGETWPPDSEAVEIVDLTVEMDEERVAWPVTIFYDSGVLTVADGKNDSYASRAMGAAGSWKKLEKPPE